MMYPDGTIEALARVVREEALCEWSQHQLQLMEPQRPRQKPICLRLRRFDGVLALSFEQCLEALSEARRKGETCSCADSWAHLPNWLFPLLRHGEGLRKSCDYVVCHQKGDTLWVLLIELKSRHGGAASNQIACTRLLIDYLLNVAAYRAGLEIVSPEYRGMVFNEKASAPKYRGQPLPYSPAGKAGIRRITLPRRSYYIDMFCS